jgi:hypothetical protein
MIMAVQTRQQQIASQVLKRAFTLALVLLFSAPLRAALIDDAVAVWLFNDGQGQMASDSVGGHHGQLIGDAGWSENGKFAGALELPGQFDSRVEVPHADELTLETWTVTAWVKLDLPVETNDGWAIILVKDPANGFQNYALDLSPAGSVVAEVTNAGNWSNCTSFTSVYDDEWHFVAGSYNGEFLSVWVDGELEGEQEFGPGDVNDAPLAIGNRLDESQPVYGLIDDLALFNTALEEAELALLMEQGLSAALALGGTAGDFDGNGTLDVADLDGLTAEAATGNNTAAFDLNADSRVDAADIKVWVSDLFNSWIGDTTLDGEFNSSDLVSVLASGTYEAEVAAVWSTGDFNGDGRANSSDLVAALADGGYEMGPRAAIAAVPEPSAAWLLAIGGVALGASRRRRRS